MRHSISIFVLLCATTVSAQDWPMREWPRKTPVEAGFSPSRFEEFLDYAFKKRLTFSTDSIVVIKDGHLVYEGYANGYRRDQKHAIWSLGKTILNALVGILEKQGRLHRNDLVRKYYPALDQLGPKDITVAHLLNMSSGLEWIEEDKDNLLQSDSWDAMYTRESYADMSFYIAKRPLIHPVGQKFNYSTGDSTLLGAVVRGAVAHDEYLRFPWRELFDKLGMNTVAIERDGAGLLGLQGLAYASPLDLAKFGLLYLRQGKVDGEALWPEDWISFTSQMAPSQKNPPVAGDRNLQNNQAYGAQIWLNKKRPDDRELPYPALPTNALIGVGTRGQILLLLPDQDLILVRTATDTELLIQNRKHYRQELFRLFERSLVRGLP